MKRKLFSMLLCAFALLLLMGAGTAPEQLAATAAEEESAALDEQTLGIEAEGAQTEPAPGAEAEGEAEADASAAPDPAQESEAEPQEGAAEEIAGEEVPAAGENPSGELPPEAAPIERDDSILIDGVGVSTELGKFEVNGVTYVALEMMIRELDPTAQFSWDGAAQEFKATTETLELTAKVGQFYIVANGRYLYQPEPVQLIEDRIFTALRPIAEAFDAQVSWDAETEKVVITRGSGAILPGDAYYDQDSLFWLSRIIMAECGHEPLKGQMSVGNVVLNRVASPIFPNSVKEVLAQKNQFSPYKNGKLAERNPNESSVIAAKLVLDGGVVAETRGALFFDGGGKSWAARNRDFITAIGNHKFYR